MSPRSNHLGTNALEKTTSNQPFKKYLQTIFIFTKYFRNERNAPKTTFKLSS